MPEGDTVFQAARRLHAALAGAELTRTDFRVPRYATADLSGERVDEVVARGKHLLVRTPAWSIHSHLKMEGEWRVFAPGERWTKPGHLARVVLETSAAVVVGFELGTVELLPRADEAAALAYLGPDLLGEEWGASPEAAAHSAAEAVARLAATPPDIPVAVALLDQRNLAGLGNVYVNELCFLRGIRPDRPIGDVPDLPAVVDLGRRLLVANRDRVARVTTGVDRRGQRLWVYGRAGEPCRRCGTRIERGEIGRAVADSVTDPQERVAFWCPNCQR
ncbi:Fpg/Nei family DNA glycosylase [Agromyces protaetiae]|uniref:DNA-(apurinic or apyrimidinic site) lyase n=1 Tax=Agromyces protaetiae TaxID=2509455 RepID=A0A4P6FDL7_9MICO|nr:DNA-formamidopyrimidine glycosylase family protein [Agromyces protaetiae]QAY74300.1 Fpg/Nei family DNA glycosylase [Agromyces protaetiae]